MTSRRRIYRLYLHPLSANSNESIAEFLAAHGISKEESEHASINVSGREVFGVYEIPRKYVTAIMKSAHRLDVEVFEQENEGVIRPHRLYTLNSKRAARTKKGKRVAEAIRRRANKRVHNA